MIERARQFAPFSALKGFYSKILEKEKIVVPRHELLEDKAKDLTYKLNQVKPGMIIKVIYYCDEEYISLEGMVSKVDYNLNRLTIVKTEIPFNDIWDIEGENIEEM